jgi:hypothetical protein
MSHHRYSGLCITHFLAAALLLPVAIHATENGASVYPVGVETVLPGITPPGHGTMLYGISAFYEANELTNSAGASASPEFKVRLMGNAVKFVHNWGLPVLGGKFNTNIVVPMFYQQLHVLPGDYSKTGVANVTLGLFEVGYQKHSLFWYYEGDLYLPGTRYANGAALNIGQNNYAVAPVAALTYLPHGGAWEVSSKYEYIVNFRDAVTNYRSGNEFTWEYVAMKEVSRKVAMGVNGYFYQQTTDDQQNAATFGDGNRGRALAAGPEVRMHLPGHCGVAFKYFHDTLVENRPASNSFWFEMGIPLHLNRTTPAAATSAHQSNPKGD